MIGMEHSEKEKPEIAQAAKNLFAFMTGSKMFISAVTRVREYLEAVKLR